MRAYLGPILAAGCLLVAAQAAYSQVYPVRPIRMVVPFAPKGAADIVGRLVATRLAGILQQQVEVENRQGGGGTLASQAVAQAAPDGYTILYVTGATLVTAPIFARTPGYDPLASFAPVTMLGSMPTVLAVHPSVSARSLDALIELIKAAPGRYRYGTFGAGTNASLAAELFKSQTQLDIRDVVAKPPSSTPLQLMAKGEADILFEPYPVVARGMKEGTVVPLAVMGHGRIAHLPAVPTTAEGGQKELTVYNWSGLVAPARTPHEIILVLNRATQSVLSEIETQTTFMQHGMQAEGSTPEQLRRFISLELTKWSRALPLSATAPQ